MKRGKITKRQKQTSDPKTNLREKHSMRGANGGGIREKVVLVRQAIQGRNLNVV